MTKLQLSPLTTRARRVTALALALVLCLCFTACKKEIKQIQGANPVGGYSFSYPENWKLLTNGAYTQITVADVGGALPYAMVSFNVLDNTEKLTAADYFNAGVDGFSLVYDSYKVLENKRGPFTGEGFDNGYKAVINVSLKGETKLDGQPDSAGKAANYTVHQLVFAGSGRICVATYMSSAKNYDGYSTVMDDIQSSFRFTDKESGGTVTDLGAAEFTIPTPKGWTLETAEAYYRLNCGKASIIASVFSMGQSMGVKDYWETSYKPSVQGSIAEFTEIAVNDIKLGGISALDVYYTGKSVSGAKYNFRQAICVYYGQVFIITLTANDADYEEASKGFEAVTAGFKFK